MSYDLSRRDVFRWGAAGALAALAPGLVARQAVAAPGTPGLVRGFIYLGMSTPQSLDEAIRQAGDIGLRRTFHSWGDLGSERKRITQAHGRRVMPWVSFGSVGNSRGGWRAIARGNFDRDLRERARHYADQSGPVIVTFHHEPHGDMEGQRGDWADAFVRIHDVMKSETGLANVNLAPIIGDWEFNPVNKSGSPRAFLPDSVLGRSAMLGTDLYQNQSGRAFSDRLGDTMSFLDRFGFTKLPVGVGETGATNTFGRPRGAEWWSEAWAFARRERDRVAAVSYFNSSRNSKAWVQWSLDESADKLRAYRSSVADPVAIRLGQAATTVADNDDVDAPTPDSTSSNPPSANGFRLLVSSSTARTRPQLLDGMAVAGNIYVFVEGTSPIQRVKYWVDSESGAPDRVEGRAPFDLAGTDQGRDRDARPFNTRQLSNGVHSVTARVNTARGTTVLGARFTVRN